MLDADRAVSFDLTEVAVGETLRATVVALRAVEVLLSRSIVVVPRSILVGVLPDAGVDVAVRDVTPWEVVALLDVTVRPETAFVEAVRDKVD